MQGTHKHMEKEALLEVAGETVANYRKKSMWDGHLPVELAQALVQAGHEAGNQWIDVEDAEKDGRDYWLLVGGVAMKGYYSVMGHGWWGKGALGWRPVTPTHVHPFKPEVPKQ